MKNISRECLIVSEETAKDKLTEITELLRLEYLSCQKETSYNETDSQDRFHILGEELTATNILQH